MRKIGVLISGLLVVITAACASNAGSRPAGGDPEAAALPIASMAISVAPAISWKVSPFAPSPPGENVSILGYGTGSARDEIGLLSVDSETAKLAIDGDIDTIWSSQQPAPQWFSVLLDDFYLVNRIQMVITQAPAGPSTHEVWLGNGSGARTLYTKISDVPTDDGQILEVVIEPPRVVSEVFILTLESPSWVAWREIKVFGSPAAAPMAEPDDVRLTMQAITSGLELPVQIRHAGDKSGRLFVGEQKGRIQLVRNGAANEMPFLDITDRVRFGGERGLIDLAFPPDFASKQHFYVSYTNIDGHTFISRFKTTENPDLADPDSEEVVLVIDQLAEHHNGGHMAFGPQDGYLYIGSGDGGSFSYPDNPALETGTLLSKLLRIDVESDAKPYRIPESNPFYQVDGYRDEIWALALRSPGRHAFDRETGDLFITDSGNRRREEVNFQPAASVGGENYGWFRMEGNLCFDNFVLPCSADGLTLPVAEYDHSQGCAIVGGAVYRGERHPGLQGLFLFADYCSGRIWGLKRPEHTAQSAWQSALMLHAPISISSIGEDEEGHLYATSPLDGVLYLLTERDASHRTSGPVANNVAVLGTGRASAENSSAHLAFDGDSESNWNSLQPAPQWFSVILDDIYLVERLELAYAQTDAGPSSHELWLGNGSGTRTLYERITDVDLAGDNILSIAFNPPQLVNELLIHTFESPGQVAWRELKVFGSPSSGSMVGGAAPKVKLNEIAAGLELPVLLAHAGDNSGRLFVAEQPGRIRIIKDRNLLETPFLDITDRVICCGEQGLIGLAFSPAFATSHQFYVSYTNSDGATTVSRFQTTDDPNRADPDSEEVLLAIDQPEVAHNGGHLAFGPRDGYLYIGSGDGGVFRDPDNMGQTKNTLLGKMLRLDVESGVMPYEIPATNPFTQADGYRSEIWALGLRNPWGFAFDKLTGDLYIPDVGGSLREEVNYQPAGSHGGENYGWAVMEGNTCFAHDFLTCNAGGLAFPVAEYDHSRGCAIVGGAVYRASHYPALQGMFIFADFCRGDVWGLKKPGADSAQDEHAGWQSALLVNAGSPVSSIGEDQDGHVYLSAYQEGIVYMITER